MPTTEETAAAAAAAAKTEADAAAAKAKEETTILDGATAPTKKSDESPEAKAAAEAKAKADASSKATTDAAKAAEEKAAADKKTADEKAKAVPEKYTFTVPEGVQFDAKAQEAFGAVAKELGLNQESAQKLVDYQAGVVKANLDQQKADFSKMQSDWKAETMKELGADSDKQLAFAAQARDKFATPEMRKVLTESGFANHPAFIKHFIALGKAISEDEWVDGKPVTDNAAKSDAEVIYGKK